MAKIRHRRCSFEIKTDRIIDSLPNINIVIHNLQQTKYQIIFRIWSGHKLIQFVLNDSFYFKIQINNNQLVVKPEYPRLRYNEYILTYLLKTLTLD